MKIGVLGSGLMGKEAARDLISSEEVREVGLADIDLERAQAVVKQLNDHKLSANEVNASIVKLLGTYLAKFDVLIKALIYYFNDVSVKRALEVETHSIGIGEHI